jgi:4-amino-4-deoxy-L-arabinose transferase-like glycosyltransferase
MPAESRHPLPIPKPVAIRDMLIIAAVWVVSILIVNPVGDFPLNDDWTYGRTVEQFLATGSFHPEDWAVMTLVTNVAWGSLFCLPAGFSFTALRLSTLTLSLIGILALYALVRDLRQPRWLAVVAALTLGANPIYYALSNTFMTDVPFIAITLLGALFLARSLRSGSDFDLTIGTVLAVAGTLSRQLALAVPLAFGASLILSRGLTKGNALRAVAPVAICLAALTVVQAWLAQGDRLPSEALLIGKESPYVRLETLQRVLDDPVSQIVARAKNRIVSVSKNTYVGALYLGLFLLPVLIFAVPHIARSRSRGLLSVLVIAVTAMALATGVVALMGISPAVPRGGQYPVAHLMPLSGNVLMASGIGPLMLRDNWAGGNYVPVLPALPETFWLVVTVLGVVGAGILFAVLVPRVIALSPWPRRSRANGEEVVGNFYVLCAVIYLLPLFVFGFIDRYLVPSIPFLVAVIASGRRQLIEFLDADSQRARYVAAALIAGFAIFAVAVTRDYLSWNRVRWNALNELMSGHGVGPQDIDGGFEFNALYLYDPDYEYDPRKGWWWVQGDRYRVTFGEMLGYRVVKEYHYQNWLPPYVGRIVVLQEGR